MVRVTKVTKVRVSFPEATVATGMESVGLGCLVSIVRGTAGIAQVGCAAGGHQGVRVSSGHSPQSSLQ